MSKTILLLGAFDSKGLEYAFLRERIESGGHKVLTLNLGVLGSTDAFPVDIDADAVAGAGGTSIAALREAKDRGEAMKVMAAGAPVVVKRLFDEGKFDGIVGMGGTGGSSVITAAMRALPLGVPKLCVSTAAAGDVSAYVGTKDIVMMPSIVDVAGINRISRTIISRAAGAICGMVEMEVPEGSGEKPIITASMFGNTTECVSMCVEMLSKDYEVLVFHAVGSGGRTMESLVRDGLVDGVLDITTTEWADQVCGGVFSAGPERLSAPGAMGRPHLIVPGCIDMANFGGLETVPQRFRDAKRLFYEWNPSVTLMRTNVDENIEMGTIFAEKANAAAGPVAFLIPTRGVSILDGEGQPFHDPVADQAFVDALKQHLDKEIPVVEVALNINDRAFSEKAVAMMRDLIALGHVER